MTLTPSDDRFRPSTATAVIVANMIGTGVFTSLGFQLLEFDSGFLLLLLWAAGGLTAFCGAMSYAELGAALPRSGGEYNFLSRIFHPAAGFVSGWVSSTIGFAAPTALAAITFGSYTAPLLGREGDDFAIKAMAVALVASLAAVHATNRRRSGATQFVFTLLKVAVIVGFCLAGFVVATPETGVSFAPAASDVDNLFGGGFAIALIYVSYAFAGWNAATYLTGEIENPQKNLPRILAAGTLIVSALYLWLNFTFLSAAPTAELAGKVEVGYVAATFMFGDDAAKIIGAMLGLLLISTVSAMTMAGPRVMQAIGEDFPLFARLGAQNAAGVPANAIWFQAAVAIFFIVTSTFQSILIFSGFLLALNSFLTVCGLFILRLRQPALARPYRVALYPITPLVYLGITGWTLLYVVIDRPREAVLAGGLIALGLVAYAVIARRR
jgi:APA family basic amino acid/polyamine antiporter